MKGIINSVADTYGTDKVHYGLITFGDEANIKISFSDRFTSPEEFKSVIDRIPTATGGPAIDKALKEAKVLFEGSSVRYGAIKVLVVMVDRKSSGDEQAAKKAAMDLKENGVDIITVAIGDQTDHSELEEISSKPGNALNSTTSEKPTDVSEQIMERTGIFCRLA